MINISTYNCVFDFAHDKLSIDLKNALKKFYSVKNGEGWSLSYLDLFQYLKHDDFIDYEDIGEFTDWLYGYINQNGNETKGEQESIIEDYLKQLVEI